MSKNIKWGCVQPLTGGMYLGAEKAIGHQAEWIISYPGLTDLSVDKNGMVIDAVNEYNIVTYLGKHNRLPNYYLMNRGYLNNEEMLCEVDYKPEYTLNGEAATPDLTDMDLVVAVPVCAGLSMASTANPERKKQCNCQMIWMANYVLKTIKPKVYIFENAPTLMSTRGDEVREDLEKIAEDNGYSIVYYKTDTKYHHNCQKRPRTFILFFQHRDGKPFIPNMNYEHDTVSVEDFFNELKQQPKREGDPMDVELNNDTWVLPPIGYAKERYGKNWRDTVHGDIFDFVIRNKEEREPFMSYLKKNYDDDTVNKYTRYLQHIDDKVAIGQGWWAVTAKYFTDCVPACMYKNMPIVVHYKEDRLYTMREWLWTMGHPYDYDMAGLPWSYFRKIGQNVPANTAKWITSEAVRIINEWDTVNNLAENTKEVDMFGNDEHVTFVSNKAFFDNSKQKRIW